MLGTTVKRLYGKKLKPFLNKVFDTSKPRAVGVTALVLCIGIVTSLFAHAATTSTSLEAENGSLTGNNCLTTDSTASSGTAVKFGATSGCATLASAPATPPVSWCADPNFPGDQGAPTSAPAGAVTVPAGNNGSVDLETANKTYWFAPGTHTNVDVTPNNNDTYIGAPGAILDGGGSLSSAFQANWTTPYYTNVTIKYLTIQNYNPDGSNGAINTNGGPGWTLKYNTMKANLPGAAIMLGNDMDIENNCMSGNGQYAFNGYSFADEESTPAIASPITGGSYNITMNNNDITKNNVCDFDFTNDAPTPLPANCTGMDGNGDAGGGKFWNNQDVTLNNNYIHDNYGGPGVWADSNNNGFTIKGNYFSNNWGQAIMYEVSYNALIEGNTFIGNAIGQGPTNPGFPTGAIYLSESGGDSRVTTAANIGTITIAGNNFTNNWGGVILWENSDRFCGGNIVYGQPDDMCTLAAPTITSSPTVCADALKNASKNQPNDSPDYFDLCRWKTQNVLVNHNTFAFTTAALGAQCTTSNQCGMNSMFSNYGSGADGVPYDGAVVPINLTFNQGNVFSNNTYSGPWKFFVWAQSNLANPVSWSQWTATVTDKCSTSSEQSGGNCSSGFGQDAGSTYSN